MVSVLHTNMVAWKIGLHAWVIHSNIVSSNADVTGNIVCYKKECEQIFIKNTVAYRKKLFFLKLKQFGQFTSF